jgi:ABC-type polysaccharide/polyol phosphate export permease
MVTAVDGFRAALLGSPQLELPAVAVSIAVAVAVTLTGVAFFWRTEDTIADIV